MVRREGTENTSVVTQLVDDNVGVRIVGRGTLAENGLPFVLVSSSSEPGRVHCVAYAYEGTYVGARIHCDCLAASYGRGCKHVGLVTAWLAEQMERAPLSASSPRTVQGRAQAAIIRAVICHLPQSDEMISFELPSPEMSSELIFQPAPVQVPGRSQPSRNPTMTG